MGDEATSEPVGVVMRTAPFAPHPLFVLPLPDAAARQVAAALVERGEEVMGLNGALPAAQDPCRTSWPGAPVAGPGCTSTPGCTCSRSWSSRGWLPTAGPGSPCPRTWSWRSRGSAPSTPTRPSRRAGWRRTPRASSSTRRTIAERIDEGRIWLWEDGLGTPVSLVGFNAPSFGVARVGPVYTPGAHRGHGYASVLTAHVSRLLRDSGTRVCLFTDQANPTSNKIYAAIGYEPVVDMANLVITTRARA